VSLAGWIVLAVLVVLAVAGAVAWRRAVLAGSVLAQELRDERARHAETRRNTEHLETRMGSLRNELADSHHTIAELTARIGRAAPGDSAQVLGLWALERHRQARLAGTPLLGLSVGPGVDLQSALADAIRVELEVLREEVGTHAELASVDLDDPVDAREALTVLRVVQELTATLAKRAEELTVAVTRDGDTTVVTVGAIGWSEAAPNAAAFESGLAALDGTLELRPDPDAEETLLAVVRLGIRGGGPIPIH
jgi:hypothetical protein